MELKFVVLNGLDLFIDSRKEVNYYLYNWPRIYIQCKSICNLIYDLINGIEHVARKGWTLLQEDSCGGTDSYAPGIFQDVCGVCGVWGVCCVVLCCVVLCVLYVCVYVCVCVCVCVCVW